MTQPNDTPAQAECAHTPGPWDIELGHIQRDSGGIRYWQISDGQDAIACNQFCYAGFDPKVNLANGYLISAAPDLLEALKEAVRQYGKPGGPWNVPSDPGGWLDRAIAAITKAAPERGV